MSPFQALTSFAGNLPGFAVQSLTFVPEPTTLVLLGAGGAVLFGCGWLRRGG